MSKKPLEVGEKVRVYGFDDDGGIWDGLKAKVTEPATRLGIVRVVEIQKFDAKHPPGNGLVHARQCRRIKRRERREWIITGQKHFGWETTIAKGPLLPPGEVVRVIEVRRKAGAR